MRCVAAAACTSAAEPLTGRETQVPASFFELCLGPRRKYSCGYWPRKQMTLEESEIASLEQVCARADIKDGMHILELGCGWGSFSLFAAMKYPGCRITAVSNSASQRRSIEARAEAEGLTNLRVITCDVNDLELADSEFDRVISIEMFEHLKAYGRILANVSKWLKPNGTVRPVAP